MSWASANGPILPLASHSRPQLRLRRPDVGCASHSRNALTVATTTVTANQTTEYNPSVRPAQTPTTATPNLNPPIPPSGDSGTAPNVLPPQATANGSLPPSALPPVHAPASHPNIDPLNPTGIIPSSGQSVYEIDLAQFEGSGQPWRQPGSDVSAYFNYGFDETTYPKFLRYRAEMEAGRQALVSLSLSLIRALSDWQAGLNPLQGMPADMAQLLHISMNQLPGGMPAMMGMGMQMPGLNPQQMQMMQQMMAMQQQQGQGMPGMDGMMGMMGMQPNGQQPQLLPQQQQNTSGMGQVPMPNPGMQRQGKSTVLRHTTTHWTGSRPSATPAAQPQLQQGEDAITVKQEDGEVSSLLPHSSVLTRVQMSDAGQTEVPPEPVNRSGQVPVARGAAPLRAARGRGAGDSLLRISSSSWLTG